LTTIGAANAAKLIGSTKAPLETRIWIFEKINLPARNVIAI
jgi:hypothetical protein